MLCGCFGWRLNFRFLCARFCYVYGNFANVSIDRGKFEFRVTSVMYFDVNVIVDRLVNDTVV